MDDLIEALTILKKYVSKGDYSYVYPTHCEHDELHVQVDPAIVSDDDKKRLEELDFLASDGMECFTSYRFGSC